LLIFAQNPALMKALYFAMLLVNFSIATALAQFSPKQRFVDGNLSAERDRTQLTTYGGLQDHDGLSVSSRAGQFLSHRLAVGIALQYSSQSFRSTYHYTDSHYQTLGTGLFVRRYSTISEKFFFYLQGGVSSDFNLGSHVTRKNRIHSATVSVTPAFVFLPSARWGIEASLGSLTFSRQMNYPPDTNSLHLALGNPTLGVSYYFWRRASL
jgi:hypothetical protein